MKLPGIRDYANTWIVNEDVWSLKFVRELKQEGSKRDLCGLCDPSTYTLYIRLKQSRYETLLTFFHEVMHAIEESYESSFEFKEKYNYEDFHCFIGKMEFYLAEFMLQNWQAMYQLFFRSKIKWKDIIALNEDRD